jgi:phage head maturation protease
MKKLEFKQIPTSTRDIDISNKTVKIALASFESVDLVGDRIHPKAFHRTIKQSPDKWHFLNHNPDAFVGRFKELYTEGEYLIGISELDTRNKTASDLLIAYEKDEIKEHSIGFYTLDSEVVEDKRFDNEIYDSNINSFVNGYRLLKEVSLFEGSSLTKPAANPDTPFLGFKSLYNIDHAKIKQLFKVAMNYYNEKNYKLHKYTMLIINDVLNDTNFDKPVKEITETREVKEFNEVNEFLTELINKL